ncbi:hypothetical protein [Clostridium sp.]|uniref:hypothetical protein n=1 Tax=Clostridium sp. TaxID=1506 RepID=UPI001B7B6A08|nr:hypothetical protein [Clostridium sp.]MBP3917517.1 hypothetical protein [Clostridium sp.]
MLKFKKDWLSLNRGFLTISFVAIIFFLIVFLFTRNVGEKIFWRISYELVDRIVMMGTMFVCFTLLASFGCILPTSEKTFSGKVKVNHLPFSNKQLAWRGIKMWLLLYPIWLLLAGFVSVLYEYKAMGYSVVTMVSSFSITSLKGIILFTIAKLIAISIFVIIVDIQITASMIISFAKDIKWYIIFVVQILINFILILSGVFIIVKANIYTQLNSMEVFLALITLISLLLIASSIYFLYSIRDIERVYR